MLKMQDSMSKFYESYPSDAAIKAGRASWLVRGSWESLGVYVGLGWDPEDMDAMKILVAQDPAAGAISWSSDVCMSVARCKFGGNCSAQQKRLHMVAYLFELGLDLCLGPRNVSQSPGFESVLGIYGGAH